MASSEMTPSHSKSAFLLFFWMLLFNLILICMSALNSERVLVKYAGCVGDFRLIIFS